MHPETRSAIKSELKTLAVDLHVSKKDLRLHMKENTYKVQEQYHVTKAKREYRHLHMAYCLLRGRTTEEVERKVRENNALNMDLVNEFLADFNAMEKENHEKFPLPPFVKRQSELVE